MRSAGYVKVIKWISDIWYDFPAAAIIKSFDSCGITSNNSLNFALNKILEDKYYLNQFFNNYNLFQ